MFMNFILCSSFFFYLLIFFLFYSQPIVTGSSVLGLKYKGGVILAADTLGLFLMECNDEFCLLLNIIIFF